MTAPCAQDTACRKPLLKMCAFDTDAAGSPVGQGLPHNRAVGPVHDLANALRHKSEAGTSHVVSDTVRTVPGMAYWSVGAWAAQGITNCCQRCTLPGQQSPTCATVLGLEHKWSVEAVQLGIADCSTACVAK